MLLVPPGSPCDRPCGVKRPDLLASLWDVLRLLPVAGIKGVEMLDCVGAVNYDVSSSGR